jgi:small subunit ribosomal protein S4
MRSIPPWLSRAENALKATVARLPTRDEMDKNINEQIIVEFYSR